MPYILFPKFKFLPNLKNYSFSRQLFISKLSNYYKKAKDNFDLKTERIPIRFFHILIGINIGSYFLAQYLHTNHEKLAFSGKNLKNMITNSFVNSDIFSTGISAIGIYIFGRGIEIYFGARLLLKIVLGSIILNDFTICLKEIGNNKKNNFYLGSEAILFSLITFYSLNFPRLTLFKMHFKFKVALISVLVGFSSLVMYQKKGNIIENYGFSGILTGFLFFINKKNKII